MKRKLLKLLSVAAFVFIGGQMNAQIVFKVEAPAGLTGTYPMSPFNDGTAGWGADLSDPANAVTGTAVLVHDGSTCDTMGNADPTVSLINAAQIAGNIAVVYRGCAIQFGAKALQAQNAGAIACVIINSFPQATDGNETFAGAEGTYGASVTIPVVMISVNTGALLRPYIDAGTLQLFIGNKTGLNTYDLGMDNGDVVRARSFAFPLAANPAEGKDTVWVGADIVNFGSADQTDVVLNAKISLNGTDIYDQTSAPATVIFSDTVFFQLPEFKPTAPGYYTLTYTASSSNTDEDLADNQVITNFMISDSVYSKSRVNSNGTFVSNAAYRPTGNTTFFKPCIVIDEGANNDQLTVHGMSFLTTATDPHSIKYVPMQLEILEWADVDNTTFNSILPHPDQPNPELFDYEEDLQNVFVTKQFDTPLTLEDGKRYLACVTVDDDSMYLGYDTGIDYYNTINMNQEYYFPMYNGQTSTWSGNPFGSDIVPAIIVHFKPVTTTTTGIKENNITQIIPYPNPAADYVNLPLTEAHKGNVTVQVFDIVGKLVKTVTVNAGAKNIVVNTSDINNGSYIFKLTFDDNTQSVIKVSVNK